MVAQCVQFCAVVLFCGSVLWFCALVSQYVQFCAVVLCCVVVLCCGFVLWCCAVVAQCVQFCAVVLCCGYVLWFHSMYGFVRVVLSLVPWYVVMFLDAQNVLNIRNILVLVRTFVMSYF